jgi:hypothetical protein
MPEAHDSGNVDPASQPFAGILVETGLEHAAPALETHDAIGFALLFENVCRVPARAVIGCPL